MLELKQIDDNTIEYNGKLFKHTGGDVVSPLEQNMKDEVLFITEDGVGIRKGDNIWYLHHNTISPVQWINIPSDWKQLCDKWGYINFKVFSTHQAAQAYINGQKLKLPMWQRS